MEPSLRSEILAGSGHGALTFIGIVAMAVIIWIVGLYTMIGLDHLTRVLGP